MSYLPLRLTLPELTPSSLSSTRSRRNTTTEAVDGTLDDWRNHPNLNMILRFPTFHVPGQALSALIREPALQPYLASRLELQQHLNHRLKVIRPIPHGDTNDKLLLLLPDTDEETLRADINLQTTLRQYNLDIVGAMGPTLEIPLHYTQFTTNYVLTQVLPKSLYPPPSSFEMVGHIAHLNLKPHHLPYQYIIGQAVLETVPVITTVINKVGTVSGPYRTYEYEVLAGEDQTNVILSENGIRLQFDLGKVYWCSRLGPERKRLITTYFRRNQTIADAFCGVGALILQAAKELNCTILANDWNADAIESLRVNARNNHLIEKFTRISCQDTYEFLMDLGLSHDVPDHVVMNYPLEAVNFLGALRWWPVPATKRDDYQQKCPMVHVYTFARPEGERSAETVAVDLVANALIPQSMNVTNRQSELNDVYGCNVQVHDVRDISPGKSVFCVSFRATPSLLRCMQGDF